MDERIDDKTKDVLSGITYGIQLTNGLLYYYGIADARLIKEKIMQLTGQEIDTIKCLG